MKRAATEAARREAMRRYSEGGPRAVYRWAEREEVADLLEARYCVPCDVMTPHFKLGGDCAVCSTFNRERV